MKLSEYLKEKLLGIILIVLVDLTIIAFLSVTSIDSVLKIYISVIILIAYSCELIMEYYKKRNFYNTLKERLQNLSEKYLIAEIIDEPNFLEGKILKDILLQTDKAMIEKTNEYKFSQEEYKEYIELWIHEIKLPIASSKLIIANHQNEITKSIDEELDKIENYVEQALFYARSNTVEKDYCITKSNLKEIVSTVIKKNKNTLIEQKIKIEIDNLDKIVYTDSKWIAFILNQIISNCIKYSKEISTNQDDNKTKIENVKTPQIIFKAEELKDKVILKIQDNGIGMKQSEIARAFEKGFTGSNGRKNGKKATGIGLYLCKKLCDKLGLGISLNSVEEQGTEVEIIFPKNSFMMTK